MVVVMSLSGALLLFTVVTKFGLQSLQFLQFHQLIPGGVVLLEFLVVDLVASIDDFIPLHKSLVLLHYVSWHWHLDSLNDLLSLDDRDGNVHGLLDAVLSDVRSDFVVDGVLVSEILLDRLGGVGALGDLYGLESGVVSLGDGGDHLVNGDVLVISSLEVDVDGFLVYAGLGDSLLVPYVSRLSLGDHFVFGSVYGLEGDWLFGLVLGGHLVQLDLVLQVVDLLHVVLLGEELLGRGLEGLLNDLVFNNGLFDFRGVVLVLGLSSHDVDVVLDHVLRGLDDFFSEGLFSGDVHGEVVNGLVIFVNGVFLNSLGVNWSLDHSSSLDRVLDYSLSDDGLGHESLGDDGLRNYFSDHPVFGLDSLGMTDFWLSVVVHGRNGL